MWLGIVLGAMAFAATAFAGSTADYIGLLDCFPLHDPSDIESVYRDQSDSTRALSLTRNLPFEERRHARRIDFLTVRG
jgi:hypothetical protein